MRADAIGLFWQDKPIKKGGRTITRVMPDIPVTGWTPPRDFPRLDAAPYITLDFETKDLNLTTHGPGWARADGHIVGAAVGVPGMSWYFPMRHETRPEENMNPEHVELWLQDTMAKHGRKPILGANLLYDLGWASEIGIFPQGLAYDCQFAEALLSEADTVALEDLGVRYLGRGKETSVLYQWSADYFGGKADDSQRKNIYRCPPSLVGPYAEQDVRLPQQVMPYQWARMQAEGLLDVFDMETRLIPLLIAMRRQGVRVDIERAQYVRDQIRVNVKELGAQLRHMVGHEVNVNAHDSMLKCFQTLGLKPPMKKNRLGQLTPTFDKSHLHVVDHPVVELIQTIKKREKIASTFIESYILSKHVKGRVHCMFHPLRGDEGGTRSGRFSSSDPNYQNVPSRDEELAPLVRSFFVPFEGHEQWRRYDYNQIEYRMLAHFAIGPGSDEIRAQYNRDPLTDYHVHTQGLVTKFTGIEIPRKPIKNFNFGMTFGMGKEKMVRQTAMEIALLGKHFSFDGEGLYNAYHEAVPFTRKTLEHYSKLAQNIGFIQTILGRRSRFDLWEPDTRERENRQPALPYNAAINRYGKVKRAYTHKALNRLLQGSGTGDTIKKAMLLCWESGVYHVVGVPCLTVHDELDHSDAGGNLEAWAYVKHTLEHAIPYRIPIAATLEIGPDWGHCK